MIEKTYRDEFMTLLDPVKRQLGIYAHRGLNDATEWEDCLQSAVAIAFGSFDKFERGSNFRAWMFKIVSQEVLNRNRKSARTATIHLQGDLDSIPSATSTDFSCVGGDLGGDLMSLIHFSDEYLDEFDQSIANGLRKLSEAERQVLLLKVIGGFKYREIAGLMEIPIGTVMGWLSRSREFLRIELVDYGRSHGLLTNANHPSKPNQQEESA